MKTLFLQYPACSTCQKAKKWLTENNIEYTNRLIVDDNPTVYNRENETYHFLKRNLPSLCFFTPSKQRHLTTI